MAFAHGGAWALGAVLKLPRGDRIALLFAAGQKSMALGAPLATVLFPPATAGLAGGSKSPAEDDLGRSPERGM